MKKLLLMATMVVALTGCSQSTFAFVSVNGASIGNTTISGIESEDINNTI